MKADNAHPGNESAEANALEHKALEEALELTGLIMNDDIDGASKGLQHGESTFHRLGVAVTLFIRSVLGFEKEVMAETTAKLADCENRALNDIRRSKKSGIDPGSRGRIYPPGTEYELVRAEAQLMGAVVGVLHESLLEATKGFYKLRKSYIALSSILAVESETASRASQTTGLPGISLGTPQFSEERDGVGNRNESLTDEIAISALHTIGRPSSTSNGITASHEQTYANIHNFDPLTGSGSRSDYADSLIYRTDDVIDVFIHSGANMCLGVIFLILSLIPPAFSRILSIVGFRGDRAGGIRMLWRSAAHSNINGALAGMILLAYYNGILGSVDIVPDEKDYDEDAQSVGLPTSKCRRLLGELRARYPKSRLWRVEESRLLANNKELQKAIHILTTGEVSKMRQVTALNDFELSINAMAVQDWNLMHDSFLACLKVNDWSPAMYYYMAGCASLELYRNAVQDRDTVEALQQREKAESYFRKAPQTVGKKRFMARQLPIETFVQRKVQKWENLAKLHGANLADVVGSSPALEMCYMWNGAKRMGEGELRKGIENLRWERCTAEPQVFESIKAQKDEMAVWAISMASLLRGQGKLEDARSVLGQNVLNHDR